MAIAAQSADWTPPRNFKTRPVAILGAGVLGRRIGCVWASAGFPVRIRDPSAQQREDAVQYIQENVAAYAKATGKEPSRDVVALESLSEAVADAWLVTECVPEKRELKLDVFAELETASPLDSILVSNSSSYRSSELVDNVSDATKTRILNMHYYMPPYAMAVELMTDGHTHAAIFPFLVEQSKAAGLLPFVAQKESTGFIFNRLWAAIKREILNMLADGVSTPAEIDALWAITLGRAGALPCRQMDNVGLDTVALIEQHYIKERGLSGEKTVDFLKKTYLDQNKLGSKCALGGLYPPGSAKAADAAAAAAATAAAAAAAVDKGPKTLIVLDIGLAAAQPSHKSGRILEITTAGEEVRVLAEQQSLPDGLVIDAAAQRLFWTNMGVPGRRDGSVHSCRLDGSDVQTLVAVGQVNTPKQIALDEAARKVYFSDREGLRVYRCGYDGSDLEPLVVAGAVEDAAVAADATNWCVGMAVSPRLGKFFWTQKGPSKSGRGRIFCANMTTPAGLTDVAARPDIVCLLSDLPEPIDLEVDDQANVLYWTDRGELPLGNSLNCVPLSPDGTAALLSPSAVPGLPGYQVLSRNFHEAIGLKLDLDHGRIFVADVGGSVYQYDTATKTKTTIFSSDVSAFTGIAIL